MALGANEITPRACNEYVTAARPPARAPHRPGTQIRCCLVQFSCAARGPEVEHLDKAVARTDDCHVEAGDRRRVRKTSGAPFGSADIEDRKGPPSDEQTAAQVACACRKPVPPGQLRLLEVGGSVPCPAPCWQMLASPGCAMIFGLQA